MFMSPFPRGIQLHVAARNRGMDNFFERLEVLHKPLQVSQYPAISPEMDVEKLRSDLEDNNQGHLLKHWDTLNETEQQTFYRDLRKIDLAKLNQSFKKTTEEAEASKREKKDEKLQPIPPDHVGSVIGDDNKAKVNSWRDKGLQVISEGKVAVLLLAGGQGTRLGVSYPKGMYDVGLPSRKTLYQLQAERILKVQELAFKKTGKKCTVTWYIMTSEHTMDETKRFFEDKNYFGLQRNDVVMFEQHTLPCLTNDGKIILDQPGKVARAPSGNGGLYEALLGKRLIDEMKKRGIEYFHVYCVDNILVKMADPVFIGFCIDKSAECGAKVVEKKVPEERVGLVVKCDGKFQVAEYSEITEDVQHKRDPDGRLTFREANLANHFFTINFLEKIVKELEPSLKFHIAKKKIPFVDDTGKRITPEKPNGIKLEKFIFDVFEFTEQFAVLEVAREEEFSPLKNGRGSPTDSPDTAQRDLYNLHYNYILRAGGKFIDGSNEDPTVVCEISPLLSYAGEGLEDVVRDRQFSVKTKEIYLKTEDEEDERNGELPCKKVREG